MKLRLIHKEKDASNKPDFAFWCPGCRCGHGVWVAASGSGGAYWSFDGNFAAPTIKPSLVTTWTDTAGKETRCHIVITAGVLHFCSDCTHALSGKSVPMEDF